MLEIIIDNRNGKLWDISQIVSSARFTTKRTSEPSFFEFTYIKGGKPFTVNTGDVVHVRKGKQNVFFGYVFVIDTGRDEEVRIKAYDQLRYLTASDTCILEGVTATQIIRKIVKEAELKVGELEDTGYVIKQFMEDNKKLLDIINKALELTLIYGGKNFVFYDDYGSLRLRNIETWKLDFGLGDKSLLYDYKMGLSIDNDTYNLIKIVRDNKKTGHRDVFIYKDSATIAKWGVLQLYQVADEKMTEPQIEEQLKNLIELKNRETSTLRLDAIGDLRVRAGCYIHTIIADLGINQPLLVDSCTHQFDGDDHTMQLDMVMFR